MPAPVFPDEPFFAHDPDLCHYLERWPELLRVADARLMETVARIDSLTLDEVRAFPERTSRDWPNLTEVGIEPLDREQAARHVFSKVLGAVEKRAEAADPTAGDYNEAYCWPVWRIYDRHWLAVVEAAGLWAVEPLLSAVTRRQFGLRSRRWPPPKAG
ncbi:MAG: hypothetical protein ABSA21_11015 [Candidatus Limnocylindrales bacterium]